jgi:hypothetical protein
MRHTFAKSFALSVALLFAGAEVSVQADDNPRTPISREWIRGALLASGVQIEPGQLEPLSSVTAAVPNPRLRVVSVEMLDGEADKIRLECEGSDTCLPFYVLVHWGQPGDEKPGIPGRQVGTRSHSGPVPEDVLVRSGKAAVLVFEGEHVHMTLPVMCLQSGGRGQRVRVISKERKKVYLARVTGPGVVTSVLSE